MFFFSYLLFYTHFTTNEYQGSEKLDIIYNINHVKSSHTIWLDVAIKKDFF